MRLLLGWSLIVLLVPAASAQAFDLEASFLSPSSVELADSTRLELEALGARLAGPEAEWSITGDLELRLYNSPLERIQTEPGGLLPTSTVRGREMETELLRAWKHTGTITYTAANGPPWVNWQSTEPTEIVLPAGPARLDNPDHFGWATSLTDARNRPGIDADEFSAGSIMGFGSFASTPENVTANVTGTQVFYNAQVRIGTQTVETGWSINESRSPAHVDGAGGHYVYDRVFLVASGDFTFQAAGTSIHYAATKAEHHGAVDATFRDATGTYEVDGQRHELDRDVLQAIGDLELAGEFEQNTEWKLEGTGVFVGVNTITVHGSRSASIPAALAAATAAAGAVVLLWKFLPRLLGLFWSRELWGSAQRAEIARFIAWNPGASLTEIAHEVGVVRMTVDWHVQRLLRAEKVSRYGGRVPAFALNSGSTKFRFGGTEIQADEVFRLLRHPVRRCILDAAASGVYYQAFCAFQEERGGQQVSQRVFSGHAKQMTAAGLLERSVRGGRATWQARIDVPALRRHCMRAFLKRRFAWPVYQVLQEGRTRSQLQDELKVSGGADLDAVLTELQALGLVCRSGRAWRAVPF